MTEITERDFRAGAGAAKRRAGNAKWNFRIYLSSRIALRRCGSTSNPFVLTMRRVYLAASSK
ncbi:protein of unknown function [Burkholderia multivorans]